MKTLYIDCGMGAAGDMLSAALFELIPEKENFLSQLNSIGIPGVTFIAEPSVKCGITGTHFIVKINGTEESEEMHSHSHEHSHEGFEHTHDGETHHHNGMHEIKHIIQHLNVTENVKENILAVYSIIAEAESHVHGAEIDEIHFHEVGTMDAVADITAVCMLMELLSPENVVVSPIHVGSGHVKCAHGILPVPAPATAHILRGIPIYGGGIKSELCTPTGAALLKHFATSFGEMPVMKVSSTGYGMGKKDFTAANCVRILSGETESSSSFITELCCNIDDMTPEAIGFAVEEFLNAGALDVYTTSVYMKKSRPGILLTVMCKQEQKDLFTELIFKHTTTLGIRENISKRYTLSRRIENVASDMGVVRKKVSCGFGVTREKFEYEDIAAIARDKNMSIAEVSKALSNGVNKYE